MENKRIPVFEPGVEWYAKQIESGAPFSFVRYGEGDLRTICPLLSTKGSVGFWRRYPQAREEYTQSVIGMPRHERYWPAIWHQGNLLKRRWMPILREWLAEVGLGDVKWHRGRVWRHMIDADKTSILVKAMKSQALPIVLIGPAHIAAEKLGAAHIVTPFSGRPTVGTIGETYPGIALEALYQSLPWLESIIPSLSPALFTFSASFVGKMLISRLFPIIGEESFMIDVGALWDGLSGHPSRPHQRRFSPEKIRLNWEGR